MQIIDCHTHLDFDDFIPDRIEVINRAMDIGVTDIIVSATTADRWDTIRQICVKNSTVCHPAYGLHPMLMHEHKLGICPDNDGIDKRCIDKKCTDKHDDVDKLKAWLQTNQAIAIGEIGLDFFIEEADESNRKSQVKVFVAQLEIADELGLPVIIHARKSLDIVLKYLRKFSSVRGVIHSFSGSEQQAKQLIDLGFYLSFGGAITYNRATRLQGLVKKLPLEAMLVETDSPDMPDSIHHAQRNEPAYILQTIKKIAEIKEVSTNVVADITSNNAKQLYDF